MKTRARAWLAKRIGEGPRAICATLGCSKPTMAAAGIGPSPNYCRPHMEYKARHGSDWHGSYSAGELKPYLAAATSYVRPRLETDPSIKATVRELALLLEESPYANAEQLRGMRATARASIAFGRLRRKGIKPERLLAVVLATTTLIAEDSETNQRGVPRSKEFRVVQVAKALLRLASDRGVKSSGRFLRVMGLRVERICEWATAEHRDAVLAATKAKRGGMRRVRRVRVSAPRIILEVTADAGRGVVVTTDDSRRYRIVPRSAEGFGNMPRVGQPVEDYIGSHHHTAFAL